LVSRFLDTRRRLTTILDTMRRAASLLALVLVTGCGTDPAAPPATTATATSPGPAAGTAGPLAPANGRPSTVAAKVTVGGQPCGVVAAAGSVWVTDAERARLVRIRGDKVVARTALDETPCELTYGYGSLWVATQSGVLDRVDPRTGKVVAKIKVGDTSYEPLVAFGSVWVTNRGSNSVSQVDPATNRVVRTIETPFVNAGGIVAAAGRLWVGNDSGATKVLRIDPRTRRVETFEAGSRPAFVAAAAGSVWVANEVDGTVTRLDERTGRAVATLPAGVQPVNLAALPGPRPEVWVPDDQGNLLTRIDATTGTVLERLATGAGPAVVAPDGRDIWVTNLTDGTVWRITPGAR
jgi:YVTN family beta-propeller protein